MSEYQYYEFQALDKPLTEEEQIEIGRLSSRAQLTAHKAVFVYNYGDFRADPKSILSKYFDALFYISNWGTTRLAFRFPKDLVSLHEVKAFCVRDQITLSESGDYVILDININEEEGYRDWIEGEEWLPSLVSLRDDILREDYRVLYLAWLKYASDCAYNMDMKTSGPPVPPGLNEPSRALNDFIEIFEIDKYLVMAAGKQSGKQTPTADLSSAVKKLSRAECEQFLVQVLERKMNVSAILRKRLLSLIPSQTIQLAEKSKPTIEQLLNETKNQKEEDSKRKAEEAENKRINDLKSLQNREDEVWIQIKELLERSQAKSYDDVVELLVKLKELSIFNHKQHMFKTRFNNEIVLPFKRRTSLINKLKNKNLL